MYTAPVKAADVLSEGASEGGDDQRVIASDGRVVVGRGCLTINSSGIWFGISVG